MSENGTKRPWLAALLAVLPGLGHVYLRLWGRALLWAGTTAVTVVVFLPDGGLAVARQEGIAALGVSLTGTALFMLSSVTAVAALDAYWHASHGAASDRGPNGAACPECGRQVDGDLDFCQWCTAELTSR